MFKNKKCKYIILGCLGIYISYVLIQQQVIMHRQNKELTNYTVEHDRLKKENKKLQDEVELSKTDKYIEKLAREKLGLIKDGETPVIDNSVSEK
ncbi:MULTISPECIES: FtsB family cell division protein [Clostridium]|uniref:Septum formation initiator family protein n=1 Tax=Clostridium senegalense TaxID=1465809 RepID=A0A6M0H5Y7_9CLOT|nr:MULTISPECIES: septum formation initiator family protein [Clostridium]MBU5226493.1 septum formation initiator family protein [Clostridium senegalense]NEU05674.1 septum formation initiator family protein [Clostridium senegalense]